MSKVDKHDHTLVWATHPSAPTAVKVPRSYLHPDFSSGWKEITHPEKSPKVQAALEVEPAAEPAPKE